MPDANEEIYSIMFSSLKHPARRKILRILADKPMTFSEMLELLQVSSSNLTYHLENLGELVTKDEIGTYKLSTFGVASVNTMEIVEEAPPIQPKQRLALPFKWKTVLAALLVGLVVMAGMTYLQFGTLNKLSGEQEILQSKYNQLLSWSGSANSAINFLQNVTQIDVSKYQATLLSRTLEHRPDLGGVIEEVMRYSLTSSDSQIEVYFRFRNSQLSKYQIILPEGTPSYSAAQPHNVLDTAKSLLERFRAYSGASYLEDMTSILSLVNRMENIEIKEGNLKLTATFDGNNARILLAHTENNIDFSPPKSLSLVFENRVLKELTDGYFLFTVGSTTVNISNERALQIARNALNGFTWSANGETVSSFNVLSEPVSVIFHPNTKGALALYPQWTVTFYLDKIYPGGVNSIIVTLWADNGEVAQVKTQNS